MDGHHKLVHWGIVIHGSDDGYCCTLTSMGDLQVYVGIKVGKIKRCQSRIHTLNTSDMRLVLPLHVLGMPFSTNWKYLSTQMFVSHYYGLQHPANQPTSGDDSDDDRWEDIMDHSDMTVDHGDLPSIIAGDQASELAPDGAAVPEGIDPFPSSNWQEVFWQALQHVH
ncbi:hypothetical protein F5J12DRAFT_786196 [Pisolithus orientalis]|uniref:uncharacterized protein n=1 Tax=Pisolithus orientalis TaxID=936130 RepID=UPI00222410ED|nr:uncharacterized protein F5J12DRAFT_786196 [Pisolithus orientalis]KAI5992292.1 hypothetical protein F5J12DRAFT_786196 [Pisolithus orientalis]